MSNEKSLMIIFSGPSGVGKGTIKDEYMKNYSDNVYFSVSATTRKPREGEIDGKDYLFVSHDEFRRMIDDGEFYEWAEVHGEYYGTPKKKAQEELAKGNDVIFDIDVQGGLMVKKQSPEAIMIFITPPSMEELEKRLRGRGTESEEKIQKRLAAAVEELKRARDYDYVVVNHYYVDSAEKIRQIIEDERAKRG